ncbi:hypothetical protein ACOMHN_040127 [Nucella lapillus]
MLHPQLLHVTPYCLPPMEGASTNINLWKCCKEGSPCSSFKVHGDAFQVPGKIPASKFLFQGPQHSQIIPPTFPRHNRKGEWQLLCLVLHTDKSVNTPQLCEGCPDHLKCSVGIPPLGLAE